MIWCVEDDASIRDIELYALTSTGFEARGFDDGASFWEALQTETPELVLLAAVSSRRYGPCALCRGPFYGPGLPHRDGGRPAAPAHL